MTNETGETRKGEMEKRCKRKAEEDFDVCKPRAFRIEIETMSLADRTRTPHARTAESQVRVHIARLHHRTSHVEVLGIYATVFTPH